jgi:hypothetical protein
MPTPPPAPPNYNQSDAIITIDELRQHLLTPLTDQALGRLIAAAQDDIEQSFGTLEDREYILDGDAAVIHVPIGRIYISRVTIPDDVDEVKSVQEIMSDGSFLDLVEGTDYFVSPDRRALTRRMPYVWSYQVKVIITPRQNLAQRVAALIELVTLAEGYSAYTQADTGGWKAFSKEHAPEREAILATLRPHRALRFA